MHETKVPCLVKYIEKVKKLIFGIKHLELMKIPKAKNDQIDTLSKLNSRATINNQSFL